MTHLSFFVACVPPTVTHHHKRIVRVGRFSRLADKPELTQARAALEALLEPHRPAEPLIGPVELHLEFTWPWLQSHTKRQRALGRVLRSTKPDCSNLAKTLEDRLGFLRFIENDATVAVLGVSKWFSDEPGIRVRIARLSGDGEVLGPRCGVDPAAIAAEPQPLHGLF